MNTKKFRGSRTCGGGTHKNRRGAGNRGGRGKCAAGKHHATRALMLGYTYGKHGFTRPQKVIVSTKTINVSELDSRVPELLRAGTAYEDDGAIHIDVSGLGIDKVLGTGRVTMPLIISAQAFSEAAVAKIEGAGGTAIKLTA